MSSPTINLDRIGGTKQSGANVVDVANTALRVNVVAGSSGGGTVDQGAAGIDPWPVEYLTPQHVIIDSGSITVTNFPATQPVSAAALPLPTGAAKDSTLTDGTQRVGGTVTVDGSGVTQPVSATSLPLPSGAATGTKQDSGNTSLASIDGKITAVNTGAVVVSSSALPSGASTGTKQDTANTSLASIDGKITAVNTGAVAFSAPQHVIVDSSSSIAVTGPLTDTQLRASAVPVSIATAPVLVAGSAIIGKVGIDQTTPGTTNGVQINAALPAGTAVIGHVIVDTAPSTAVTNANLDVAISTLAKESGGNLATLVAKDFATTAKQDTGNTSLATIATNTTGLLLDQGDDATSATGPMMQALVSDGLQSYTNNVVQPLSMTVDGRLRVSTHPSDVDRAWDGIYSDPYKIENPWQGEVSYV